jgi:hypothetical protein
MNYAVRIRRKIMPSWESTYENMQLSNREAGICIVAY